MEKPTSRGAHAGDRRAEFMGLDVEAAERLRRLKPALDRALPQGLDALYERLQNTPEIRDHFRDQSHMDHARSKQLEHWRIMSSASYDTAYYESARRIGLAHAMIGLEPRWYIGSYAIVLESMIEAVVKDFGGGQFWARRSPKELAAALAALMKAVFLDMELAVSIYFEKTEADRSKLTEKLGAVLKALADSKDLTVRLEDVPPSYAQLEKDFNFALSELERSLLQVSGAVKSIDAASGEIAAASDDLSRRTESQAASLEQTTAALAEITLTVTETADRANTSSDLVTAARQQAEQSGVVAHRAIEAMEKIEGTSRQINEITSVIDEIAFQTNLLALNAGVEAARAGEAGRGFVVVASEVRALAQRSGEAAQQIKGLISTSQEQVETGVELVAETRAALEKIIAEFAHMTTSVTQIATNAKEQATGLGQVSTAVGEMDQMTQQNAAMVEQTTAATQTLAQTAQELTNAIEVFRLSRQSASANAASRPTQTASELSRRRPQPAAPIGIAARPARAQVAAGGGARHRVQANAAVAAEPGWEEF